MPVAAMFVHRSGQNEQSLERIWAKVDKTVLSKRVSPPPSKEEVYMYYVMVITWYFFIENKKKDKSSMTILSNVKTVSHVI
jgi:hypothetical protein